MESLFGSVIFEIIGAGTKWIYFRIRNLILGQAGPRFEEIYKGTESKGSAEHLYGGMSSIAVGMLVVVILACVFVELVRYFHW